MWDLPRPGIKPMSPTLAGGFLTTAPPGKSCCAFLKGKNNPYSLPYLPLNPSLSPHLTPFSHSFTALQTFWFSSYSSKFHCSHLSAFVVSSAWNVLHLDVCIHVSFSPLRFLHNCYFLKKPPGRPWWSSG